MKLLIDNNLSYKLLSSLSNRFPGSHHVKDVMLLHADDIRIWNYAKQNDFVILTKDNDFDERSQLEGCPPKIIHLICGNKSTMEIIVLLQKYEAEIVSFVVSDFENCILKVF